MLHQITKFFKEGPRLVVFILPLIFMVLFYAAGMAARNLNDPTLAQVGSSLGFACGSFSGSFYGLAIYLRKEVPWGFPGPVRGKSAQTLGVMFLVFFCLGGLLNIISIFCYLLW